MGQQGAQQEFGASVGIRWANKAPKVKHHHMFKLGNIDDLLTLSTPNHACLSSSCSFVSTTSGWQQTPGASWSLSPGTRHSTSSSARSSSFVWRMRFLRSPRTSHRSLFLKIARPSSGGWRAHLHSLVDCSSYPPFKTNQDCRLQGPNSKLFGLLCTCLGKKITGLKILMTV